MPEATALSAPMREALRKQEHADLVVGIPSFRNAATIGHVARVAAEEPQLRRLPIVGPPLIDDDGRPVATAQVGNRSAVGNGIGLRKRGSKRRRTHG